MCVINKHKKKKRQSGADRAESSLAFNNLKESKNQKKQRAKEPKNKKKSR